MGYESDFLAYLERMIRDLDRKITRGQDRLRRSAEAKQQVNYKIILFALIQFSSCRVSVMLEEGLPLSD